MIAISSLLSLLFLLLFFLLAPTGISAPTLSNIDSSHVQVTWTPPTAPNGVLVGYYILRTAQQSAETVLTFVSAPTTSYVDASVQPYTAYSYRLQVVNDAGSTYSTSASITSAEAGEPSDEKEKEGRSRKCKYA